MTTQTPTPPKKYTLEEIIERKQTVLNEIHAQKTSMTLLVKKIVAPVAPAASQGNALLRSFNTGMALFDGVMMGIKFMRKVRSFFKRYK